MSNISKAVRDSLFAKQNGIQNESESTKFNVKLKNILPPFLLREAP